MTSILAEILQKVAEPFKFWLILNFLATNLHEDFLAQYVVQLRENVSQVTLRVNPHRTFKSCLGAVAYPGILFGGGSTNSVEDRGQTERRSGGSSPLVRGSGGSCNLVQEISFPIVNFS